MSEEDTNQQKVIIVDKESKKDSESSDYRAIDDVAAAKETLGENDSELTLADTAIEVRRLYEENKRILETEQKQKDIILAEKQKIEAEIADKNILLSVSRNYKN